MPPRRQAFRDFVKTLKELAANYRTPAQGLSRGPTEGSARQVYKRLLLSAHPDKGGDQEDFKKLQAAREALDEAAGPGRPWPLWEACVWSAPKRGRLQALMMKSW